MNKNYERPVAEVISFTALEQMASLPEIDSMNIKMDLNADWSLVNM